MLNTNHSLVCYFLRSQLNKWIKLCVINNMTISKLNIVSKKWGPSWSWSNGSTITYAILSPLKSSNTTLGELYLIQYYVIKFVSYLRQVGGFHQVAGTLVSWTNETDHHSKTDILLIGVLNMITLTSNPPKSRC